MRAWVSGDEPPPATVLFAGDASTTFSKLGVHLMGAKAWGFALGLAFLVPDLTFAQVFSFVDKNGTPVLTDSFFELPTDERARLLKQIDKRAANRFTPTQIGAMKAKGTWPPLELLQESINEGSQKPSDASGTDYEALQKAARQLRTNFSRQRTALNREKEALRTRLPALEKQIENLQKQRVTAHTKDVMNRSVGKGGFLDKLDNKIAKLKKEKTSLEHLKNGGLRAKERRINRGELVYRR